MRRCNTAIDMLDAEVQYHVTQVHTVCRNLEQAVSHVENAQREGPLIVIAYALWDWVCSLAVMSVNKYCVTHKVLIELCDNVRVPSVEK